MSRRLLAVGGTYYEGGCIPQTLTTNALVEGEITRQKGGGRKYYEDDNNVRTHRSYRGRNKHFVRDGGSYSTYHNSRYANNSGSVTAETTSDSEITVTTSSSKSRQRQRKNRRRIRTYDDSLYKVDDECDYRKRRNAAGKKNCMRVSKERPSMATNTQAPRAKAGGQSGKYLEQTVNYPANIDENDGTTKEMLRFMDTLFRTLGNVQVGAATNSVPPKREENAPKVPQTIENTRITNQDECNAKDIPQNMANYQQNYTHFGMHFPQQIAYQTDIMHAPTQNTRYPTFNKNSANPQLPPQELKKGQSTRFIPQRYEFLQYPSALYSQPTTLPLCSSMPQEYMPEPTRNPIACTPPPSAAPIQVSIQTLPPGMHKSYVEEYTSRTPQEPTLQNTSSTVQSLEQANPHAGTPSKFNTNLPSFAAQQPIQLVTAEERKQNTEFSLPRNSHAQPYHARQPASQSNQYVMVKDGAAISRATRNINEIHYLETQQASNLSKQYLTSNDQIAEYSFGNESRQQPGVTSQKLDMPTDSVNKPSADLMQFTGVENSEEETVKLKRNIQAYNYNVINIEQTDIENKMNESRTNEQEETKRRSSKTLQEEASRKSRKDAPVNVNHKVRKSEKVGASRDSKTKRKSKYGKKRESTSETNAKTGTEKEINTKNNIKNDLELGESKNEASNSCDSDYIRECLRRKCEKNKNKRRNHRHRDSSSDSDSDQTSNGYTENSSYSRRNTRRKHYTMYTPTDSDNDDDIQYSLSRTSCKELKKCCSRIVAICRMARDTAATQTEQWDDGASLSPQRSNKLVDELPKSIVDGLAAANPKVVEQIMQLNRDRRKCRVCACGVLDETGAPVVKDDMIILKFDENEPKLSSQMCMERRSRCTCNCGCKSDAESEIIREIIRKKRLQEKSKRISALTKSKYDSCDCHSACDFVDEEDEREFIENLLRKQRRNRDRERDRTQAQNIYEDCVCDCGSKAKELAAEIMHEMVKNHIQKIITDNLQNKTCSHENQQGPENASVDSSETITSNENFVQQVHEESVRSKPRAGVCTCDLAERPRFRPKTERIKPQAVACTCDSDETPTVTPKSERTKPRNFECTCDARESRTEMQAFTKRFELQSGSATKSEMASTKRQINSNPEQTVQTKKKRKSDNEEYITLMQKRMATERKSDASSRRKASTSGQESRARSLEAQQESYGNKNAIDPQINHNSNSGERVSISIRKDKTNPIKKSFDEEYVPSNYHEDTMKAQRKNTVKSHKAGPTKPANDELKRCRDDCTCKEIAAHPLKMESAEEEYEEKIKAQPKVLRTTKATKELRTCRADCTCKQGIEIEKMEGTMVPKYNNSDADRDLRADSDHGSIQKLIIDVKASKKAHASCTLTAYAKSNKNAERNTHASLDREAQSSDPNMLLEQRAALCAELTMNELLPQHSLRTLLTKLSRPDAKLYATDELKIPRTDKRRLSATTVMAQNLHITGKQSKSDTDSEISPKFVSENRQQKPPNNTPPLAENRGLSANEREFPQQNNTMHVINRQDGSNNKFAKKSLIPLPVNSNTYRSVKQAKSVSKSSSAEKRANQRPLIDQTSNSNHQITRLWPEKAGTTAQHSKLYENEHAQMQTTANDSSERVPGKKQITKSQSNIELSYDLNYSVTGSRLESGRHDELPKLSSQESRNSDDPSLTAENVKENFDNSNPENTHLKMVNMLSTANQCPTSSSGLSSESCNTNDLQKQSKQRYARCRAVYKKTGVHRNIKELQGNAKARANYVPQPCPSPTLIPATIHATSKHRRVERFSTTDDEQTDSDIECITVEYGGSESDSYTQYQDELLRKQQLWRKATVKEALEVEERAERAKNLQRTTLTGECLERAIHYPTRVWNEERKQLNLQRNGAGIFGPL